MLFEDERSKLSKRTKKNLYKDKENRYQDIFSKIESKCSNEDLKKLLKFYNLPL